VSYYFLSGVHGFEKDEEKVFYFSKKAAEAGGRYGCMIFGLLHQRGLRRSIGRLGI